MVFLTRPTFLRSEVKPSLYVQGWICGHLCRFRNALPSSYKESMRLRKKYT